ncbi:MAG: sortase [Aggregatilineales bacterium]
MSTIRFLKPIFAFCTLFVLTFFVVPQQPSVEAIAPLPATLSIPSIGVNAPVLPVYLRQYEDGNVTWDVEHLRWQVGHLQGTTWFGQNGTIALGGHSEAVNGSPDIFYNLEHTNIGDIITVNVDGQLLTYQIAAERTVTSDDLSILNSTGTEMLTIFTCDISSYQADGSYSRRHVVFAVRVS